MARQHPHASPVQSIQVLRLAAPGEGGQSLKEGITVQRAWLLEGETTEPAKAAPARAMQARVAALLNEKKKAQKNPGAGWRTDRFTEAKTKTKQPSTEKQKQKQ